ncbi:hypothetical protein AVEN_150754-1, partial [Araneus ventricosus]
MIWSMACYLYPTVRLTRSYPVMPVRLPGTSNDSRCYSSSTEAGVLVAITDHSPSPPVGDT